MYSEEVSTDADDNNNDDANNTDKLRLYMPIVA